MSPLARVEGKQSTGPWAGTAGPDSPAELQAEGWVTGSLACPWPAEMEEEDKAQPLTSDLCASQCAGNSKPWGHTVPLPPVQMRESWIHGP